MAAKKDHRESGPDGKVYVDAVLAAGQRSRGLLGIILLLTVVTFAAVRNNQDPGWSYERVQVYADLLKCLKANNLSEPACGGLKKRIGDIKSVQAVNRDVTDFASNAEVELEGEFGSENFLRLNENKLQEIGWRYRSFTEKDAGIRTITIPVLGMQIDYNDIWLVSGVIMFFLLLLLRSSLEQEYRNIRFIAERQRGYLHIVILNQVITFPYATRPWTKRLAQGFWLIPTLLFIYLFYLDCMTFDNSVVFIGRKQTIVEYAVECVMVVAVAVVNIQVLRTEARLQKLLETEAQSRDVVNQG